MSKASVELVSSKSVAVASVLTQVADQPVPVSCALNPHAIAFSPGACKKDEFNPSNIPLCSETNHVIASNVNVNNSSRRDSLKLSTAKHSQIEACLNNANTKVLENTPLLRNKQADVIACPPPLISTLSTSP